MASNDGGRAVEPRGRGTRPWYLIVTMGLMWLLGMTSSASGCSNVGYLRGSHELPDTLAKMREQSREASARASAPAGSAAASGSSSPEAGPRVSGPPTGPRTLDLAHPLVRASLAREEARLEAMSAQYRRAFPLSLGQTLLGLVLVFASMATLGGRRSARSLALQAIAANAVLLVVTFALLGPVRQAMADAVAREVGTLSLDGGEDGGRATLEERREEMLATDRQLLYLQLGLFALAATALTRPRTTAFLDAAEARRDDDSEPTDA
ncbi:MAG: hypothetical protein FJ095_14320 [Deltaproteobacteria bacterium]|nr:hypothetical protein [Deltaproteobacteria bacterium]